MENNVLKEEAKREFDGTYHLFLHPFSQPFFCML